ncbi:MAG TPA: hypothetical protein VMB52_03955 [Verrucomicrobiae bacterium]|nr:hypothetical protein [Verrucomicrobiae bacterium]
MSLDAVLGVPGAAEAMLDSLNDKPELIRWLHEEVEGLNISYGELADMIGVSPSTTSRLMANKPEVLDRARVMDLVNALATLHGKKDGALREYSRTARSLYKNYLDGRLQHSVRRPNIDVAVSPITDYESMLPLAGLIGATVMEGLSVISGDTGRFIPARLPLDPCSEREMMLPRRASQVYSYHLKSIV